MGTVSENTFFTNVWNEVESYLNSNLTNPHTTGQWIYSTIPKEAIDDITKYPLIVIPSTDPVVHTPFTNATYVLKTQFEIGIYSRSALELDSISSEVLELFKTRDLLKTTKLNEVHEVTSTSRTLTHKKNVNIHVKLLTFEVEYYY